MREIYLNFRLPWPAKIAAGMLTPGKWWPFEIYSPPHGLLLSLITQILAFPASKRMVSSQKQRVPPIQNLNLKVPPDLPKLAIWRKYSRAYSYFGKVFYICVKPESCFLVFDNRFGTTEQLTDVKVLKNTTKIWGLLKLFENFPYFQNFYNSNGTFPKNIT
jgi:hypothetical protein